MKDPYEILGVARAATQDEIRKAYHRLAKKLHPDLNPGDKNAEDRFKEIASAYDLLSDAEKRRRFDSGEIDASGAEAPRERYYRDYAAEGQPYASQSGYADFLDTDDLLAEMFRRQSRRARGSDLHYSLTVDFLDAVNGATKRIALPQGGSLDVTIAAGIHEGQVLRLRGKGAPPPARARPATPWWRFQSVRIPSSPGMATTSISICPSRSPKPSSAPKSKRRRRPDPSF